VVVVQDSGQEVNVTVTHDFGLWFGQMIGWDTVTLTKVSVMPRWRNN